MHGVIKSLFILSVASLFSISPIARSQEARIYLKFTQETLSVNLEEAPLTAVIKRVKEEKGIWFKGNESLLDEKISLQFEDLPIEDGMARILSAMNYSLLFDRDSNLVGVILVGKRSKTSVRERTRPTTPRRRAHRRTPPKKVTPPQPRK